MNTLEKLNEKYNGKYNFLKLLSVVYDEELLLCTITFLYPYQIEDLPDGTREEVALFYKELLNLNGELKIKFKRSFLDARLVIDATIEYLNDNAKSIFPYIERDNISSSYHEQNVELNLKLNQDIFSMIDDLELANSLREYLEKQFIASVQVNISANCDSLPDEIEHIDLPPAAEKTRRYEVNVEKKIIGGDIVPKPEYISDIKEAKSSVILSGLLSKKERKTFTQKKGKRIGEERVLYTFQLTDDEGAIDCVYFCGKTHDKEIDALEDMFMILCVGDVRRGINGKLTYYIRKMSAASHIEQKQIEIIDENGYVHKKVVTPESIFREQQDNFLEEKVKYNDFIMKNNIVVFDIETTGLDPEFCEITELGAVKIVHGEIVEKFSSFAKPKFSIPQEVQDLTHITNEMVANAPRIEDVIYDFYEWSKDCFISGYNIVGFDLKFVRKVATSIGLKFDNEVIDAFIVARQSKIKAGNYKLGSVVKALGITLNDAHRAYNDAFATAMVLLELNKLK